MIRKPLRKFLGLLVGKKVAAAAAEVADRALVKVGDRHTGGLVSRVDEVV